MFFVKEQNEHRGNLVLILFMNAYTHFTLEIAYFGIKHFNRLKMFFFYIFSTIELQRLRGRDVRMGGQGESEYVTRNGTFRFPIVRVANAHQI